MGVGPKQVRVSNLRQVRQRLWAVRITIWQVSWIAYTSLWWFVQLTVGIPFAESGKHTIIKSRGLMNLQSRHNSAPNGPSSTASFSNCLGFSRCVVDAEHLGVACDLRVLIVVS